MICPSGPSRFELTPGGGWNVEATGQEPRKKWWKALNREEGVAVVCLRVEACSWDAWGVWDPRSLPRAPTGERGDGNLAASRATSTRDCLLHLGTSAGLQTHTVLSPHGRHLAWGTHTSSHSLGGQGDSPSRRERELPVPTPLTSDSGITFSSRAQEGRAVGAHVSAPRREEWKWDLGDLTQETGGGRGRWAGKDTLA